MKKKRYLLLGRALLCGFCAYLVYTHSLSLSFSNGLRVAAVTKYGGIVEERERGNGIRFREHAPLAPFALSVEPRTASGKEEREGWACFDDTVVWIG